MISEWERTKEINYERKYNLAIINKRYIKAIYYWIMWKRWEKKLNEII